MKGKLYLAGGGEAQQSYEADKKILKNIKKILYIPIAWDKGPYEGCKNWFESMLKLHDNNNILYEMLENPNKNISLNEFDLIYIGGGNTFKLLKELKESGLDLKIQKFLEEGGTVYGGSAGAIIWGKSIELCQIGTDSDKNKVGLKNLAGFNVLNNHDIQCHYNTTEFDVHKEFSEKTQRKIIAIPEESILEINENKLKVLGTKEITLFEPNGNSKKLNS